jgi:hypothetical protein
MFVLSLSASKIRKLLIPIAVVLCVFFAVCTFMGRDNGGDSLDVGASGSLRGASARERLGFIASYGWEVDEEPAEVREIAVPAEFDDVYQRYNELQLSQGFDLSDYAGRSVKRWTYIIKNYPGNNDEIGSIRINLLVCDGIIIGGDVCSVKLDGFMHGFSKNSEG